MKRVRLLALFGGTLTVLALLGSLFLVVGEEAQAGNLEQAAGDPVAGKAVFSRVCAACHLNNGLSAGRAPVLAGKARTAEFVTNQVRNGGTRMPKIGPDRVSDAELPNVVAYVLSLASVQPEPAPATTAAGSGGAANAPAASPAATTAAANAPAASAPSAVPAAGVGQAEQSQFNPLWAVLALVLVAGIAMLVVSVRSRKAQR